MPTWKTGRLLSAGGGTRKKKTLQSIHYTVTILTTSQINSVFDSKFYLPSCSTESMPGCFDADRLQPGQGVQREWDLHDTRQEMQETPRDTETLLPKLQETYEDVWHFILQVWTLGYKIWVVPRCTHLRFIFLQRFTRLEGCKTAMKKHRNTMKKVSKRLTPCTTCAQRVPRTWGTSGLWVPGPGKRDQPSIETATCLFWREHKLPYRDI